MPILYNCKGWHCILLNESHKGPWLEITSWTLQICRKCRQVAEEYLKISEVYDCFLWLCLQDTSLHRPTGQCILYTYHINNYIHIYQYPRGGVWTPQGCLVGFFTISLALFGGSRYTFVFFWPLRGLLRKRLTISFLRKRQICWLHLG